MVSDQTLITEACFNKNVFQLCHRERCAASFYSIYSITKFICWCCGIRF